MVIYLFEFDDSAEALLELEEKRRQQRSAEATSSRREEAAGQSQQEERAPEGSARGSSTLRAPPTGGSLTEADLRQMREKHVMKNCVGIA